MSGRLSVLLVVVGSSACAPRTPPVDVEAARAALRAADEQYTKAGMAKDLEGFVALYAADATIYAPESPAISGTDAIRAFGAAIMADSGFTITLTPVAVEVSAGGDMGYTLNIAELTATGADGKPVTERIRDFHLWRTQADGSWEVVVDIWNAEAPPSAPQH